MTSLHTKVRKIFEVPGLQLLVVVAENLPDQGSLGC